MPTEVSQRQFAAAYAAGAVVVDVREPDEYQEAHVPGALLMPLGAVPSRAADLPTDRPVYVICRSGGRSAQAVAHLRGAGVQAVNVAGGTEDWVQGGGPVVTGTSPGADERTEPAMPTVVPIETPGLGDRTYLAHDGRVAVVVDPQRDFQRVLEQAERAGVRITHVFETHVHNDYVTGGYALSDAVGAQYLMSAADPVQFERVGLRDGDVVEVSPGMAMRVLHTPGHTHTHLSYALESAGRTVAVFTGGSLLFGSTGRPDLLGDDHTPTLVRAQWRSARRLAGELPDDTAVYPTHGFGSFCSASDTSGTASTIGQERRTNIALTSDEEDYVRELLAGLDAYPAYYAHMGPANLVGPVAPDLTPPAAADPAELRRRIEGGEWVVDLRNRRAFAAGHVAGTLNFGLDGQFVTYLGWLIPWGTPVTLLGETAEDVAEAQLEMARIGIDRPAAMATGGPRDWAQGDLASFERATFADLAEALAARQAEPARHGAPVVLDVRRDQERAESHLAGSTHLPIHEVLDRLDEVPDGALWVHCAGGYRASVVAALLAAHGHDVVAVDDDFDNAAQAGLDVVSGAVRDGTGRTTG